MCTLAAAVSQYVQAIKLHGVGSDRANAVRRRHATLRQFSEYADALDAVRIRLAATDEDTVDFTPTKSSLALDAARRRGLPVIDLPLGEPDPSDLRGVPSFLDRLGAGGSDHLPPPTWEC